MATTAVHHRTKPFPRLRVDTGRPAAEDDEYLVNAAAQVAMPRTWEATQPIAPGKVSYPDHPAHETLSGALKRKSIKELAIGILFMLAAAIGVGLCLAHGNGAGAAWCGSILGALGITYFGKASEDYKASTKITF